MRACVCRRRENKRENGLEVPRNYIWGGATSHTQKLFFMEIEVDPNDVVKQWTEGFPLLAFSPSTVFFIQNFFKLNRNYKSYLLKGGESRLPIVI